MDSDCDRKRSVHFGVGDIERIHVDRADQWMHGVLQSGTEEGTI